MNKIYFALFLLIFVSCAESEKTNTITIEDRYSMEIPEFMTSTTILNSEASLQYMNALKEIYVVVIDENKLMVHQAIDESGLEETYSKDLEGYSKLIVDQNYLNNDNFTLDEYKTSEINGLKIRTTEAIGKVENIDCIFLFGFIEGKNYYYQVSTWTMLARKNTYLKKMYKMIHSFKELSKK